MQIKEIDSKIFDEFVLNSNKAHFMQTSTWAKVNKTRNYNPKLLGFFSGDKLVASALLLEKKILNYKTYYCPRGPIIDYSNKDLIKEIVVALKKYVKDNNGLYLKINPDLIIRKLNEDASFKEINQDNFDLIDYFKSLGFKHRGFTTKFSESSAPRYTFRIDINKSEEELLNSFHNTTRKILKRNNPYGIEIVKGNKESLNDFYKIMKETSLRKKIYVEPFSYFSNFYEILNKDNSSDIFLAYADINKVKKIYDVKINDLENKLNAFEDNCGKKKDNEKQEIVNQLSKLKKDYDLLLEIKEDKICLSSVITAKFKNMVWLIHGGNSDRLSFLNANYELYWNIILDSKRNSYEIVDFFGSEGKVDKSSNIYGIYLFKLRFSGDFDEFIGEFDLITKPIANFVISKLLILRRKLLHFKSLKN